MRIWSLVSVRLMLLKKIYCKDIRRAEHVRSENNPLPIGREMNIGLQVIAMVFHIYEPLSGERTVLRMEEINPTRICSVSDMR